MKKRIVLFYLIVFIFTAIGCQKVNTVNFTEKEHQIDVCVGNQHFTSYCFGPELTKPVLIPVMSPSGIQVNRHHPPDESIKQQFSYAIRDEIKVVRGRTQTIIPRHKASAPIAYITRFNNGDIQVWNHPALDGTVWNKRSKDGGLTWYDVETTLDNRVLCACLMTGFCVLCERGGTIA